MSKYTENEQQRKVLPFRITPIGGKDELVKWKECKAIKWADLQRRRQAKFDAAKSLPLGKVEYYESPANKEFKRIEKMKRLYDAYSKAEYEKNNPIKETKLQRLTNKAIDWFLSLEL